jgi:hypothetical protein
MTEVSSLGAGGDRIVRHSGGLRRIVSLLTFRKAQRLDSALALLDFV